MKKFNLKVYSTKKSDRGLFNVYCGHALVGSGNEYSAGGETNTQVVFDKKYELLLLIIDRGLLIARLQLHLRRYFRYQGIQALEITSRL